MTTPNYIVISRTNQVLLNFLKLRIIIDNKDIYPLVNDKPIIIPVDHNFTRIVASDGYHFTRPLELVYQEPSYYKFKVTCAIEDMQLLGGGFLLVLFYLLGFLTNIFALKLLSFTPIIYFLFLYYIRRKEFIRLMPVRGSIVGNRIR